jgi:hypothetical protein
MRGAVTDSRNFHSVLLAACLAFAAATGCCEEKSSGPANPAQLMPRKIADSDHVEAAMAEPAGDAEPKPDKSIYNLFHPTPVELMREFETDRPDATEAARTLDAGHFAIEAGVFSFALDDRNPDGVKRNSYDAWNTNFKVGLLNNVDFHVIIDSYVIEYSRENGRNQAQRGFGDVELRSKINLFGNDTDGAAFALLPFIRIPTGQAHHRDRVVEGGLITPWTVPLPEDWTVSGQFELDLNQTGDGRGHHVEYGGTLNFNHDIIRKDVAGFVEFSGMASTENKSRWAGSLNIGCTYSLSENIHIDGGVSVGVTPSAPHVNPFVGFSLRF